MNKTIGLALVVILICLLTVNCNAGIYGGISFSHEVENVKIKTSYRSDYGETLWKITDNKKLYIKLEVVEQPVGYEVLIEHMHADVSIHAYKPHVDGLLQDTMDDKMHTGTQAGFYVSPEYAYHETFAVEGYSKFLIEGWGFLIGYYGWTTISEQRLTEDNLKKVGAVGSEVIIVYDVLIKSDNETLYHKYVIADNFYIFFNGDFEPSGKEEEQKRFVSEWKVNNLVWIAIIGVIILTFGIASLFVENLRRFGVCAIFFGVVIIVIGLVLGIRIEQVVAV